MDPQTISIQDLNLPAGYCFAPTHTKLIRYYLIEKILNRPLPATAIMEYIDYYDIDPDQDPISDQFLACYRNKDGYGFTHVVPGRTTRSGGHWKASGPEVPVMDGDEVIGFKSYFVYYSAGEEKSAHWTMLEYRVNPGLIAADSTNIDSTFVICKVQYKDDAKSSSSDSDSSKENENKMDSNNQTISIEELPPGFHFQPTDLEIIREFLIKKILNLPLPNSAIKDIAFYDFDPELLPIANRMEEAYFFTQLVAGQRTTKSGGHWKASGRVESIMRGDEVSLDDVIGFRTYFVFYSAGENKSSNWTMHEYRVNPGLFLPELTTETVKSKIDTFVICNVHKEDDEDLSNDETTFSPSQLDQNEETMDNETATSSRLQSDQGETS
ncbi:hypothetical protein Dsin_016519 [Dipteronia sinensis]|uniref:NAC domain-containing protein n=1 Tax=Dipteronia sinensis TaxID=43782 RepID=A0AAE0AE81_9ROSI|nr:hypothetical protein Dsin_016519 [Dipteronia sinensis]